MTGKSRVKCAIAHAPIDRCPIDMGFTSEASDKMMRFLGVESHEAMLSKLGADCRHIHPVYKGPMQQPDGDISFDEWGIGRKSVQYGGDGYGGTYDDIVVVPLADATSVDDVLAHKWPDPDWWDYHPMADVMRAVSQDYWVTSGAYSIFERSWGLMGMERFLTDLVVDPEIPLAVMDKVLEFYTEQTLRILRAADGLVDQIDTCDDVGTQRGMLLSPRVWREHIKPRQAEFNSNVKSCSSVKLWYHSCGSIVPIIEDLIEIGVDVLDPIQTGAEGMAPEWLNNTFGDRLCFHGGVDTQRALPYGTVDEVRAEVGSLIHVLGRGGGYILSPTHIVQSDVPPENVLAMCQAVSHCSKEGL